MKRKLLYGIATNDADYNVIIWEYVKQKDGTSKRKMKQCCPFYLKWKNMLKRCYSSKYQNKHPSYKECSVIEEWKTFSNFKSWMEKQDWEGKELDKDILFEGNKIYSPETCVFVSSQINSFLTDRKNDRGEYPLGVSFEEKHNKYRSGISINGRLKFIGYFDCPDKAHNAWKKAKHELAIKLANTQKDPRVTEALINRYKGD